MPSGNLAGIGFPSPPGVGFPTRDDRFAKCGAEKPRIELQTVRSARTSPRADMERRRGVLDRLIALSGGTQGPAPPLPGPLPPAEREGEGDAWAWTAGNPFVESPALSSRKAGQPQHLLPG